MYLSVLKMSLDYSRCTESFSLVLVNSAYFSV